MTMARGMQQSRDGTSQFSPGPSRGYRNTWPSVVEGARAASLACRRGMKTGLQCVT
ncbi:MAG TPA: hypothetical protein VMM78_15685 [Thermomicrobiales bacterium]|nr:hypothetical protein [Thermomicrobiales bacterium]